MKRISIALALLVTLSSPVSAQDFQTGLTAWKAGDYSTAYQVWVPLAEAGDASSQESLGYLYSLAVDPLKHKEAAKMYQLAAEQGFPKAQYNLGFMYEIGKGVLQNYAEAVKWYRPAAEQGFPKAQYNLGIMYNNGQGVLQNSVMAHMWYNIASFGGHYKAGELRDGLAGLMTPADISKAQAMARECMSSGYKKCGY